MTKHVLFSSLKTQKTHEKESSKYSINVLLNVIYPGTHQLLNASLNQLSECDFPIVLVENVVSQNGNGFSVSLRLKCVTLLLKEGLDVFVVGDDAIVDDYKFCKRNQKICQFTAIQFS